LFLFLGCHGFWQAVEVSLIGRERFQAGVRPDGVTELQVAADGSSGLADRGVGVQVNLSLAKIPSARKIGCALTVRAREYGASSAGSRMANTVGAPFDCSIPGGCQ